MKYINLLLLGVVVLVGIMFFIDCYMIICLLDFEKLYSNLFDVVLDCDFIIEFLFNVSILMMYLLCFCEEIINWCSYEY